MYILCSLSVRWLEKTKNVLTYRNTLIWKIGDNWIWQLLFEVLNMTFGVCVVKTLQIMIFQLR